MSRKSTHADAQKKENLNLDFWLSTAWELYSHYVQISHSVRAALCVSKWWLRVCGECALCGSRHAKRQRPHEQLNLSYRQRCAASVRPDRKLQRDWQFGLELNTKQMASMMLTVNVTWASLPARWQAGSSAHSQPINWTLLWGPAGRCLLFLLIFPSSCCGRLNRLHVRGLVSCPLAYTEYAVTLKLADGFLPFVVIGSKVAV